ncbi:DNA translocase FtsK [Acidiferrimicrobium sp. IK]|uniref:DNA translocase FtsK n=1 Tax=Acidiferrimicrobium sp. IK TaxID=2871700 RepID=UPI0021CB1189|nr:DNA translocase FtsK [Acidiferrimicrobium sp. IK]MCU4183729.1 DNA translocase FtsK [Acidiferrimicrobium sp. IK]
MATATRRTPSSRGSSRRAAPKKKAPARRHSTRPAPRPPRGPGLGARLREVLGRQTDDVWGVALIVLAVLAALGIWSDLAGPAGRAAKAATGDLLGRVRYLVPVALAGLGGVLISGEHRPSWRSEQAADAASARAAHRRPSRVALGTVVGLLALAGLADNAWGPAHWPHRLAALRGAGGLVGAGAGIPLRAGLAVWGATLVLLALLAVALLVVTGTPARDAAGRIAYGLRSVARGCRAAWRWALDTGNRDARGDAAARHPTAGPYDQESEAAHTARKARSKKGAGAPTSGTGQPEAPGVDDETSPDGAGVDAAPVRPPVPITLPPAPDAHDADPEQMKIALGPAATDGTWRLPPVALLKRSKATEIDRKAIERLGQTLEDALASHGVETRLVNMTVGPSVTRYELELGPSVKVAKVTSLQRDIAYAMAAADVRILAPIPGRSAIGIEVPNVQRQLVAVGDIMSSAEAHEAKHPLEVAMGRDIAGRPVLANLATMPHILIAGATGAGKSSCINSVLTSLLVRATPDQVRLILVDPKRVELGQYNGLPHLLTQVVTNPKKAANALSWAVHEMERRYDLLAEVGVRDITGYNDAYDRGDLVTEAPLGAPVGPDGPESKQYARLPFIVIVIDELNDLMMVAKRDVEESIVRIAQMARAVGIHLVIATQRPSVDVITGVIKANVPSRLAFAVSSLADSRVILDQPGAERLIGKGDMLLLTASSSVARRIQGSWVDEDEVRKVVAFWRRQSEPRYVEGVEGSDDAPGGAHGVGGDSDDDDDMLEAAMDLVVRSQLGSTSMLQRKLRVGFARAGRIMDLLEQRGVVGPSEGSKARTVLMTVEELEGRSPS